MGNSLGVRRDFDVLESRRLEAARLLREGSSQAEVARRVGVHRQSVSRWAKELGASGIKGLRKAGRAGRKPMLSLADRQRVERKLKQGAQARGYETALWTTSRVADLIEEGHRIPVARVQAMHEGKRRARVRRAETGAPS